MAARLALLQLLVACAAASPEVLRDPFTTKHARINCGGMDSTSDVVDVWYPDPTETENTSVPLLSYAHGMGGGGVIERLGYGVLGTHVAGFGIVLVAPRAGNVGCLRDLTTLPGDPPAFANFSVQQLQAIACARSLASTGDKVFRQIDFSSGVGVAAHSMGGQATLFSADKSNNKIAAAEFRIICLILVIAFLGTLSEWMRLS